MTVNLTTAVAAYNRALRQPAPSEPDAGASSGGGDFASALREVAEGVAEILSRGEAETLKAAAGQADLTDVVTAMSQAEITLQTVVTLRDRVIQAYQDIMRMPI